MPQPGGRAAAAILRHCNGVNLRIRLRGRNNVRQFRIRPSGLEPSYHRYVANACQMDLDRLLASGLVVVDPKQVAQARSIDTDDRVAARVEVGGLLEHL